MRLFCARCAAISEQQEAVLIYDGRSLCKEHYDEEIKK
jgi:hypothetical protein